MPPLPFRTRTCLVAIVGLILCFLLQAFYILSANSQTFDEAVHLAAGHRYLSQRDFSFNREHPPLTKLLAALPAYLLLRPRDAPTKDATSDQWFEGRTYLYSSATSAERLLAAGRLSNVVLGVALLAVIARWSWILWGPYGALTSAALLAFDPNILAHSSLATTDLGASFFFVLALYLLCAHIRHRRWLTFLLGGIALGLALAAKFSMVILLPIASFVFLAYPHLPNRRVNPRIDDLTEIKSRRRAAAESLVAFAALLLIAEITLWACYLFGDATVWLDGFTDQWRHQVAGHPAYLMGAYSHTGWWHYFIVAYVVKTPVGVLLAVCSLGLYLKRAHWRSPDMVVISIALATYALIACGARTNIGLRYVLPCYILMFVPLGAIAAGHRRWPRKLLFATCIIATAAESLSVLPHHLSFFNLAVGGPKAGHRYLSDSNLDWGQDLGALADWLHRKGNPVIYLSYFGTAPPEYFGIRYRDLPTFNAGLPFQTDLATPKDESQALLAISVVNLQGAYLGDPATFEWLRAKAPLHRIGHSIMIYDVTHDAKAHRYIARAFGAAKTSEGAKRTTGPLPTDEKPARAKQRGELVAHGSSRL